MTKRKEALLLALVLAVQSAVFALAGLGKSYLHMDEAYSLGLASYERVELQDAPDFYGVWHNGAYYQDYLQVDPHEAGSFSQVYENQKNDVHPPLYYLLLRLAMGTHVGRFSMWSGMGLNMVVYLLLTPLLYAIVKRLLAAAPHREAVSAALALLSALTLASVSNAIYIRMYALSTLNVVLTAYLHLRLLDQTPSRLPLLAAIAAAALAGSLTHYYYLFYLLALAAMFAVRYLRARSYRELGKYAAALALAGGASLLIFPYSIGHLFFGYRGQGALQRLTDPAGALDRLWQYVQKLDLYLFHRLLFPALLLAAAAFLCARRKKPAPGDPARGALPYLLLPALVYFLLAALSSPWVELRYLQPICPILLVSLALCLVRTVGRALPKGWARGALAALTALFLVLPAALGPEPEVLYSDKREIVSLLSGELNVPTFYVFNPGKNRVVDDIDRFLDDIYLFSQLRQSYIAKAPKDPGALAREVLAGRDLSRGILVFINKEQDNAAILADVSQALELGNVRHLQRLNACDVYHLS